MRAYLTTGPHLEAMRLFPATSQRGLVRGAIGWTRQTRIPDWSEINAIWRDHGRIV
jgi:hypothetical protein